MALQYLTAMYVGIEELADRDLRLSSFDFEIWADQGLHLALPK